MICHIIREKTPTKQVRRYHTDVIISKKACNRINRIPGVTDLSISSGYEICVSIGKVFSWERRGIDKKIILILQANFVSKKKLDSDEEMECVVEDIDNFSEEPTLVSFCQFFNSLEFLNRQKNGQRED